MYLSNKEKQRDFKQQRAKSYLCFGKIILESGIEMDKKRDWKNRTHEFWRDGSEPEHTTGRG